MARKLFKLVLWLIIGAVSKELSAVSGPLLEAERGRAQSPQVGVAESGRIFEPIAEGAVKTDMRGPNQGGCKRGLARAEEA